MPKRFVYGVLGLLNYGVILQNQYRYSESTDNNVKNSGEAYEDQAD